MTRHLERGRESFRHRAWAEAFRRLSLADEELGLGPEDLERIAIAAYLVGRDRDHHRALDRAHRAHGEAGDPERAARCAFWLGLTLMLGGDQAQASGWLARARRLVEDRPECVEHGYLLLPVAEEHLAESRGEEAYSSAATAADIGERLDDPDLVACARHLQGRARIRQGDIDDGLSLLDEVMVAVVESELSPLVTGLVYCSVIETCHEVFALRRAREWTAALTRWCEGQPEMIAFTRTCLVHRAEILQLQGSWPAAMTEASLACDRAAPGEDSRPPAAALYRQGEIHRLRGELAKAEKAYRDASRGGSEPQPGWALLRLDQGRVAARRRPGTRSRPAMTARTHRPRWRSPRKACGVPASAEGCIHGRREENGARGPGRSGPEAGRRERRRPADQPRAHRDRDRGSVKTILAAHPAVPTGPDDPAARATAD